MSNPTGKARAKETNQNFEGKNKNKKSKRQTDRKAQNENVLMRTTS